MPPVVGGLTALALVLLVWLSMRAGEEFEGDRTVDWWPAPWLPAARALGAAAAVAARNQR